ncbi:Uncharacterised protein [Streptococcus pneumoniae]|nr:Uncharacterised protein [Streptococcus pneumoniae]
MPKKKIERISVIHREKIWHKRLIVYLTQSGGVLSHCVHP